MSSSPADELLLRPIALIENDFPGKFGLPRQSGLLPEMVSRVRPLPPFDDPAAYRGIEGFSHLWLLWGFGAREDAPGSEGNAAPSQTDLAEGEGALGDLQQNTSNVISSRGQIPPRWSATVRPPRLGGNRRVGVFATRSPNRPNPIGLSSVRLLATRRDARGLYLEVVGGDFASGTRVFDIKPYLAYTDAHPDARDGFAREFPRDALKVELPPRLRGILPPQKERTLLAALAADPRPAYQSDPARVYSFAYAGREVRFTVAGDTATVIAIEERARPGQNM